MKEIRYTLLSDGSSDRRLLPILTWILKEHLADIAIQSAWADLRWLPQKPAGLSERIHKSIELYPCDLLFIHRDAEAQPAQNRRDEILAAMASVEECAGLPTVCVVPVRMQEAWLLIDECALRRAAGNPNGKQPLNMPPINRLEHISDPKHELYELIRQASGLSGHRRRRVPVIQYAFRVADLIEDFAPLRGLSAFNELEADIIQVVQQQGWLR